MKKYLILLPALIWMSCGGEKQTENTETGSEPNEEAAEKNESWPEPIGECPAASSIDSFTTTSSYYTYMNDFDFSAATNVGAVLKNDGGRLKICFSNKAGLSAVEMSETLIKVPVDTKDQYIFTIVLSNAEGEGHKIVPGEYTPSNTYGKMSCSAELSTRPEADKPGTNASLGLTEGKITLVSISKDKVCGTYELSNSSTRVKGSFTAPLTIE